MGVFKKSNDTVDEAHVGNRVILDKLLNHKTISTTKKSQHGNLLEERIIYNISQHNQKQQKEYLRFLDK